MTLRQKILEYLLAHPSGSSVGIISAATETCATAVHGELLKLLDETEFVYHKVFRWFITESGKADLARIQNAKQVEVEPIDEEKKDKKHTETVVLLRDKILNSLLEAESDTQPIRAIDLARELNRSKTEINRELYRLGDDGLVRQLMTPRSAPRWVITNDGKERCRLTEAEKKEQDEIVLEQSEVEQEEEEEESNNMDVLQQLVETMKRIEQRLEHMQKAIDTLDVVSVRTITH